MNPDWDPSRGASGQRRSLFPRSSSATLLSVDQGPPGLASSPQGSSSFTIPQYVCVFRFSVHQGVTIAAAPPVRASNSVFPLCSALLLTHLDRILTPTTLIDLTRTKEHSSSTPFTAAACPTPKTLPASHMGRSPQSITIHAMSTPLRSTASRSPRARAATSIRPRLLLGARKP